MKTLLTGYSTGTCAAAAAKAAAVILVENKRPETVVITLPDSTEVVFKITESIFNENENCASAAVVKYAGEDPDVTNGLKVHASVEYDPGNGIHFFAGDGVGTVTKPGLSVPPGEPAINPVPRKMITDAVRGVTDAGMRITISIENGESIARKTFNPRLGIVGGLSVLGTSGRVVPYSCSAVRESFKCTLDVALANGVRNPVFVPGNIGRKAALEHFLLTEEQLIEVGNEWGYMTDEMAKRDVDRLLVMGHPGKLAKLITGHWDTHSKRSPSAIPVVCDYLSKTNGTAETQSPTVEGLFAELSTKERHTLANMLSENISVAIEQRLCGRLRPSVVLINMQGVILGRWGNLSHWRRRP
jgi:cobalt-precorrin-5B (C1)-methyltransferase